MTAPADQLPLFQGDRPYQPPGARTGKAEELGKAGLQRTAGRNDRLLERLAPIAVELARGAAWRGVTVTDVRKEGIRRGILTGHEKPGTMSALGALMRRAGLIASGERRKSDLDCTHGRPQVVWVISSDRWL